MKSILEGTGRALTRVLCFHVWLIFISLSWISTNGCKPTPTFIPASEHNRDAFFQISRSERGNSFTPLAKATRFTGNSCPFEVRLQFIDSKPEFLQLKDHFHTHHAEKTHNISTYLKNATINWLYKQMQKIAAHKNKLTEETNTPSPRHKHSEKLETADQTRHLHTWTPAFLPPLPIFSDI